MGLFKKRADHRAVLKHIVNATTQAALDDTDEARQRAADHIVADLSALDRNTLIKTAALAAMCEGDARAEHIKRLAQHTAHHLIADLEAMASAEEGQAAAERAGEAPEGQDPLPDVSGDETAAQGWAEDRT